MKALSRLAVVASGSLLAVAAWTAPAIADTAPVLSCGTTVATSCSQTATFTDIDQWLTPVSSAPAS